MVFKRPLQTRVFLKIDDRQVDLVDEILSVFPDSLQCVDPDTLFAFAPSEECPGNTATIGLILEQLEKRGIELNLRTYLKISEAINILVRLKKIKPTIFRDRVLRGRPYLGLKPVR